MNLDLDEESGGSFLHSAQSRALLMQKLTRDNPLSMQMPMQAMQMSMQQQYSQGAVSHMPTPCLLLTNMFSRLDAINDPGFFTDLKEEIMEEFK